MLAELRNFTAILCLVVSCGGDKKNECYDHIPGKDAWGMCRNGAKLVVEDRVAVCRCPKPKALAVPR